MWGTEQAIACTTARGTCHRDRAEPPLASCRVIPACPTRGPLSACPHHTAPSCQLCHQPSRRYGGFPRGPIRHGGGPSPGEDLAILPVPREALFP
ncbi:unnamed protein product, partial [Gulo gulo]